MTEISIIKAPEVCPFCGHPVEQRELQIGLSKDLFCSNENCPERVKNQICYFIGKGCMDINDCGGSTVELLIKSGLISNYKDLYKLTVEELIWVAGMTEYSAEKLYNNIQKSKRNADAVTILYSLGIPNIGRVTAEKILTVVENLDFLYDAMQIRNPKVIQELIKTIGEVATESLMYYDKPEDIKWFVINGFKTTLNTSSKNLVSNKLVGLRILASGTFDNYSRDEIKDVIEENGGTYASGVNKKLDILVCGKNMGPSKLDKAKKLGIKMISEQEFTNMLQ